MCALKKCKPKEHNERNKYIHTNESTFIMLPFSPLLSKAHIYFGNFINERKRTTHSISCYTLFVAGWKIEACSGFSHSYVGMRPYTPCVHMTECMKITRFYRMTLLFPRTVWVLHMCVSGMHATQFSETISKQKDLNHARQIHVFNSNFILSVFMVRTSKQLSNKWNWKRGIFWILIIFLDCDWFSFFFFSGKN